MKNALVGVLLLQYIQHARVHSSYAGHMKNELIGVVYIAIIKHPRVHSSYDPSFTPPRAHVNARAISLDKTLKVLHMQGYAIINFPCTIYNCLPHCTACHIAAHLLDYGTYHIGAYG